MRDTRYNRQQSYQRPPATLEEMQARGHRVMTKYYDSMGDFLTECENNPHVSNNQYGRCDYGREWHGASSFSGALRIIREGITGHQKDIDSLVDKASVSLPSMQDAWVQDVAGACPVVPMAIAGLPDNMLRLEQQETSGVPLRIFVSVAYSSACANVMIRKRGIAILALLESLSAKRPVELLLFGELDDNRMRGFHSPIVRVDTMPLDQTTLTAALISPVVLRVMFMGWCHSQPEGFYGTWAFGSAPNEPEAQSLAREALGVNSGDLVIHAAYLDEQDLIIRDPLEWIKQQIKLTEVLNEP